MDDELIGASLTEISIDPAGPTLRVGYSIPDQGGTRLLYEYSLPPEPSQEAVLATGYAHEARRDSDFVSLQALPRRLVEDAVAWVLPQISQAKMSGQLDLAVLLERFREVLARSAA